MFNQKGLISICYEIPVFQGLPLCFRFKMVYFNVALIYFKEIVCIMDDYIKIENKIRHTFNIVSSVIDLKTQHHQ